MFGGRNFQLSSHCPSSCLLSSLIHHVSETTNFQTQVVLLLLLDMGERIYPFPVVPYQRKKYGTPVTADQQRVLWPNSSEVSCSFFRVSVSYFLLFSFLCPLISQKLNSRFFYLRLSILRYKNNDCFSNRYENVYWFFFKYIIVLPDY